MILSICLNCSLDTRYTAPGFTVGGIHSLDQPHISAGGKGLNLARVAAQLGEGVLVTGLVGADQEEFFVRGMDLVGARSHFVATPAPTRRCLNIVDPETSGSTQILERGHPARPEDFQRLLDLVRELAASVTVICASGSVPPGLAEDVYASIGQVARELGKPLLLDARGIHLRKGLEGKPFAVKPNRDELADFLQRPILDATDLEVGLGKLADQVELAIVSLGAGGAKFQWQDQLWTVSQPPVTVRNSVGSGDAFMAGLAAGINRNLEIPDCLALAAACGIANAQDPATGHISPEQVKALVPQICVQPKEGLPDDIQ